MNLIERQGKGLLTQHIDALREACRVMKQAHPFMIEAMMNITGMTTARAEIGRQSHAVLILLGITIGQ